VLFAKDVKNIVDGGYWYFKNGVFDMTQLKAELDAIIVMKAWSAEEKNLFKSIFAIDLDALNVTTFTDLINTVLFAKDVKNIVDGGYWYFKNGVFDMTQLKAELDAIIVMKAWSAEEKNLFKSIFAIDLDALNVTTFTDLINTVLFAKDVKNIVDGGYWYFKNGVFDMTQLKAELDAIIVMKAWSAEEKNLFKSIFAIDLDALNVTTFTDLINTVLFAKDVKNIVDGGYWYFKNGVFDMTQLKAELDAIIVMKAWSAEEKNLFKSIFAIDLDALNVTTFTDLINTVLFAKDVKNIVDGGYWYFKNGVFDMTQLKAELDAIIVMKAWSAEEKNLFKSIFAIDLDALNVTTFTDLYQHGALCQGC